MITGELKSQIDSVWNDFWSGGISNPLEVMEQLTLLLFIKGLDERHTLAERKARSGAPLTTSDIAELQRILVAAGIGNDDTFARASEAAGSFGLFIRSLVGLDREAAKAAFADFLDDKRYSRNQIQFVNLIINELTEQGVVEAARIYETPYDDIAPSGPEAIFVEADLDRLFGTLKDLAASAG